MKVKVKSVLSGKDNEMELDINDAQLNQFNSGVPAKLAFPQLNPDQLSFIVTGVTPEEFKHYMED